MAPSPPRMLLLGTVIVMGLVDCLARYSAGPVSALAVETIVLVCLCWAILMMRPTIQRRVWFCVRPLAFFLIWALAVFTWAVPTRLGLQNMTCVLAFVGFILLGASESHYDSRLPRRVGTALEISIWIAMILNLGEHISAKGSLNPFMTGSGRSFALFALLGIAWYVARSRHGSRTSLWLAIVLTLAVLASLSRGSFVVALVLFALARLKPGSKHNWIRLGLLGVLTIGLLCISLFLFPALQARFFEGDTSMRIGSLAINAMGRTKMWQVTLDSFRESPWIGKGAGSAAEVVRLSTGLAHPHNDYLRLLHDYGMVGFGLWLLGTYRLLRKTWQAWTYAARYDRVSAHVHLAAFLAGTAFALAMVTQNNLAYIFMTAPTGILIGISLGRSVIMRPREHHLSATETLGRRDYPQAAQGTIR